MRARKCFSFHPRSPATAALDPHRTLSPYSRAEACLLAYRRAGMWVPCVENFRTVRCRWTCSAFFPDSPSRKQMMGRARTCPANIQPSILPQLFCPLLPSRILGQSYGGNHLPKGKTPFMAKRPVHFGCSFCGVVSSALDAHGHVWMRVFSCAVVRLYSKLPRNGDCVDSWAGKFGVKGNQGWIGCSRDERWRSAGKGSMASAIDLRWCTATMVSRVCSRCWTSTGRFCVEFLDLCRTSMR